VGRQDGDAPSLCAKTRRRGSAAAALRLKSIESGAGRFTDFLLPPLTFHEYLGLLEKQGLVTAKDDEPHSTDIDAAQPRRVLDAYSGAGQARAVGQFGCVAGYPPGRAVMAIPQPRRGARRFPLLRFLAFGLALAFDGFRFAPGRLRRPCDLAALAGVRAVDGAGSA